MTVRRLLTISILLTACGTSARGETCSKTGDCQGDLACIGQRCTDPAAKGEDKVRVDLVSIRRAIEMFLVSQHRCPRTLDEITKDGHAIDTRDPWGTEYRFTCDSPTRHISARSAGKDRVDGTDDDISTEDDVEGDPLDAIRAANK